MSRMARAQGGSENVSDAYQGPACPSCGWVGPNRWGEHHSKRCALPNGTDECQHCGKTNVVSNADYWAGCGGNCVECEYPELSEVGGNAAVSEAEPAKTDTIDQLRRAWFAVYIEDGIPMDKKVWTAIIGWDWAQWRSMWLAFKPVPSVEDAVASARSFRSAYTPADMKQVYELAKKRMAMERRATVQP